MKPHATPELWESTYVMKEKRREHFPFTCQLSYLSNILKDLKFCQMKRTKAVLLWEAGDAPHPKSCIMWSIHKAYEPKPWSSISRLIHNAYEAAPGATSGGPVTQPVIHTPELHRRNCLHSPTGPV